MNQRKCKICGEMFEPTGRNQRYCGKEKVVKCVICGKDAKYLCGQRVPKTCSNVCQGLLAKQVRKDHLSEKPRICKWCGKLFIPKDFRTLYCDGPHYKKCVVCGKEFEVIIGSSSNNLTCSKECMNKYTKANLDVEEMKSNLKKTLLEKYGVEHSMQIPGVLDKMKQTCVQKYGTEWYTQTQEYRDRVKQTSLEKYGVEHHLKSPEVIQKRTQTVQKVYGVDNVFQSDTVKEKSLNTIRENYGVDYISQNPEIHRKAIKNAKESGLESRICALLENYGLEYIHHYVIKKDDHIHEFDFFLPQIHLLIDADGLYYHSYLDDPDGERIRDDYDEVRLYLVPEDCRLQVIVEGSEEQEIKQIVSAIEQNSFNLSERDSSVFEWCRSIGFPYPNFTETRLYNDWKHLNSYSNNVYVPQCRIGQSIVKQFHRSIYHCHVGSNLSPYEGWNDDNKLKQVIRNRFIYINNIDPSKVLSGFNISKICPCVSTFNPVLARYLSLKYLRDFDSVFDPFSGFSGRLIGVASTGKSYLGQDLNEVAVMESNQIIGFLNLDSDLYKVRIQNVLESEGEYQCLMTCPPYFKKEIYNKESVFKQCDDWIKECLNRFKCQRYVFVVDETEDFKDYVKEEIKSSSHFSDVSEKVIVI